MADTVKRTFYFVKSTDLPTIPEKEGNVYALSDATGFYYDVGNPAGSNTNVTRHNISAHYELVQSLPQTPDINTIYILDTGLVVTGTDLPLYDVYVYDDGDWKKIATNSNDYNVLVENTDSEKFYLAGSNVDNTMTGSLLKRSDVFVTSTGKINANGGFGGGKADEALKADVAESATMATKDSSNNTISEYFRDVAVSGRNVTFTRGDGNTQQITTYESPVMNTSTPGLVPTIPGDTTKNVLFRDGWGTFDPSHISVESAQKDGAGQVITDTYIKNLSFNTSTKVLTGTKGDGTSTVTTSIPYVSDAYSGNTTGLVPASTAGSDKRYLRVNGIWSSDGLTPTASAGDANKFLKGDNTWSDLPVFAGSAAGIVPTSDLSSQGKYLKGDGTWADIPIMVGADGTNPGTSGMVPAPTATDDTKSLLGDGTWGIPDIPIFDGAQAGLVPSPSIVETTRYLSANRTWEPCVYNTAGAPDIGSNTYQFISQMSGDSTTTTLTLQYIPNAGTLTVTADDVALVENTDYTITNNIITFTTAPASGVYIKAQYAVALSNTKLYIVGSPIQDAYNQTYTKSTAYSINGKLYSEDKAVATTDQLIVIDDSTTSATSVWSSSKVNNEITNLPNPMIFKGTLGTGGTIQTLPTASSSNEGYTYKVITAGTYASISAKVGDVFVSNATEWVLIPAGDEDSDTWRNIKVNGTEILGSAISTGALDLVAGNGITLTNNNGAVTIDSAGKILPAQTLTAGSTTITFTDSSITANSLIDVYAPVWYSDLVQSSGSAVITFPVQASNISVQIKVS